MDHFQESTHEDAEGADEKLDKIKVLVKFLPLLVK